MNRDLEVELEILLTSSILDFDYREVKNEIINNYNSITYFPLSGYDGTLYSMARSSGGLIDRLSNHFNHSSPDIAICYADRFELLPFALTCAYMNIPLAQIQAGEDSGNIDQKVRHAVSYLADKRFTAHKQATSRLSKMGLDSVQSGCPSIDVIVKNEINKPKIPEDHIICIFHPHTKEIYSARNQLEMLLSQVSRFIKETGDKCYYFMSNNDPGYKQLKEFYDENKLFKAIHNVPEKDYLKLLSTSKMIVGNSSSGLREACYLGVPAVNVGLRQQGRIRGSNVTDCNFGDIYITMKSIYGKVYMTNKLFGDGNSAEQILKELKAWKLNLELEKKNKAS